MLANKEIGKMIRAGRKSKDMTQEDLAKKVFVTKQAVSDWELGKHCPDRGLWGRIDDVLGIDMTNRVESPKMNIVPVTQIENFNTLESVVSEIINSLVLDSSYERAVKKLLEKTLYLVLGYECYCRRDFWEKESDDDLDWALIAWDVEALITQDVSDLIPAEAKFSHYGPETPLAKKIHFLAYRIGGHLFEDFDEDGFRNGFIQQLGRYGESCGYDLLNILPAGDNSLLTLYKLALLELSEIIGSI